MCFFLLQFRPCVHSGIMCFNFMVDIYVTFRMGSKQVEASVNPETQLRDQKGKVKVQICKDIQKGAEVQKASRRVLQLDHKITVTDCKAEALSSG